MNYSITQVRPGDSLWVHIAEHSPQTIQYMTDPDDGGHYHCFMAVAEDHAFLGLSIVDIGPMRLGPLAHETTGFLENIFVLPAFRRRGIGTALLQAALNAAWHESAKHVRWTVGYDDEGLPFYHSLGFVFVPEEDPHSENPERYYTVVATRPKEADMKQGTSSKPSRYAAEGRADTASSVR